MKKRKDTFECPRAVFEDTLTPKTRVLLIYLFSIQMTGGQCDPGYEDIQQRLRCSDQTVNRAFKRLKKLGWLYNFQKSNRGNMRFWLRIPQRLRSVRAEEPDQPIAFEVLAPPSLNNPEKAIPGSTL